MCIRGSPEVQAQAHLFYIEKLPSKRKRLTVLFPILLTNTPHCHIHFMKKLQFICKLGLLFCSIARVLYYLYIMVGNAIQVLCIKV